MNAMFPLFRLSLLSAAYLLLSGRSLLAQPASDRCLEVREVPAAFSERFEQSAPPLLEKRLNPMPWFTQSGPVPINLSDVKAAIVYPQQAIDAGVEGRLVASILVDAGGQYVSHIWLNSPSAYLAQTLDPYLGSILFLPASKQGRATAGRVVIPFVFRLKVPMN